MRRLGPGGRDTVSDVLANWNHVGSLTNLVGTVGSIVWGIVQAPDTIIDMLAKSLRIRLSVITDFCAELVTAYEVSPVLSLLISRVVAVVGGESVGIHKSSNGVTTAVLSSRVEFTSKITVLNVDLGLVKEAYDLDVPRALDELNTF